MLMLKDMIFFDEKKANQLPVLNLAYIGDAVYELLIREYLLKKENEKVKNMHQKTVELVRAKAQAKALDEINSHLDKSEASIVRRARNTKINNPPKSVELADYRKATALEALFGYLYLSNNSERLLELFDLIKS